MVKFLIQRPIAVTVTLIAFIVMSIAAANLIPVSLMPAIDIPEVVVKVDVPEKSAQEVESYYVNKIRRQLLQVTHLKDVKSYSTNGQGYIRLLFDFGSDLNYAFIEVNEKIDAMMYSMPRDFNRPRVIKTSATDIPVFYLSVSLKKSSEEEQFMQLSEFCEQVIKKRIEQLPEVAMADISGMEFPEIALTVDLEKLNQLGITRSTFENALKNNNYSIGNIKVRSGLYEFNVRYASVLKNRNDIENISITVGQRIFKLKELAKIDVRPQYGAGVCLANGKRAIVMAVIKKSSARMADLKTKTAELIELLKKDYPRLNFNVERNQTKLLDYSIGNLETGLVIGGFLAFIILFLFLKDIKSPLLIGISVPVSIVISLLLFYLFDVSINIISLSGLILGTGMMIDNSIIVIDNIAQHRDKGLSVGLSCIKGTNEVMRPLISSVLTTCAVFVPLVFIKGMAGALFYDQAMAISIGLGVSLLVSFTVIPVYFRLFYRKEGGGRWKKLLGRVQFYKNIENSYGTGFDWVFRKKKIFLGTCLLLLVGGFSVFQIIEKEKFPAFEEHEAVVDIDWNRNITLEENERRITELMHESDSLLDQYSCMIGAQKFVLDNTNRQTSSQSKLYLKGANASKIDKVTELLNNHLKQKYPQANVKYGVPENIFERVFKDNNRPLEIRLKNKKGQLPRPELLNELLVEVKKGIDYHQEERMRFQRYYEIKPRYEKLQLYNVPVGELIAQLKQALNRYQIFTLRQGQYQVPVFLSGQQHSLAVILSKLKVTSKSKAAIPISALVDVNMKSDYREFTGDKSSVFVSANYDVDEDEANEIINHFKTVLKKYPEIEMEVKGALVENRVLFKQLLIILGVSLLLLYFILAAQFESLLQPIIVLLEIPIDIAGAVLLLWLTGNSINMMAMIGMIVMTGIIINDSILKIDTINQYVRKGMSIMEAIHKGGTRRLKPIIMTSLTTILAMVPFLFGNDMGSRLQQPLAISIIGGMSIGTLVSLYFIPLCYYYLNRKKEQLN
ncbi:efflux RND transporter permease subunit [Prolixibacteraceae bacterium JC049]|nr:efflux RND transporter permease subunit [Prolixibacteraceae bacterium JC049]